jgi:hypothetical protein
MTSPSAPCYARHQPQDRVPEDQEQHRRHGADAAQEEQRRTVHQAGEHEQATDQVEPDRCQLDVALDRAGTVLGIERVDGVDGGEPGGRCVHRGEDHHRHRDALDHQLDALPRVGNERDPVEGHECRHDVGEPGEDAVVDQRIVPPDGAPPGEAADHPHDQVPRHEIREHGEGQQYTQPDQLAQQAMGSHPFGHDRQRVDERVLTRRWRRMISHSRPRARGANLPLLRAGPIMARRFATGESG